MTVARHSSMDVLSASSRQTDQVAEMAINLARNCGWSVFPCLSNKKPACPNGFKDSTSDPTVIADLWRQYSGPLIGIATGARSGFDVLDIDAGRWQSDATVEVIAKHEAARAWWHGHADTIPSTRTYVSVSGGLHLYFRHAPGLSCTQSKIAPGVDTRSEGGYIVFWFAAGCECVDHAPLAFWPSWLLDRLLAKPKPPPHPVQKVASSSRDSGRSIEGILRLVAAAQQGERNAVLHWAACRLGERVQAVQISAAVAETLLMAAAMAAGLPEGEARATVHSGLRRTHRS